MPNAIKIGNDAVYCTAFAWKPVPHSALIRIRPSRSGSMPEPEVLLRRALAFFDDFDFFGDGFVVAEVGGLRRLLKVVGELLFVDARGRIVETVRQDEAPHPSAVRVVARKTGSFEENDLLLTEKASHGVIWLRPRPELSERLARRPEPKNETGGCGEPQPPANRS